MQPREVLFVPHQLTMDSDRTLPLQKPDHHRNAAGRRCAQTKVDMVYHRLPLDQFHPLLPAQILQDRSDPAPCPPIENLVTVLRYENYMILAIPSHVGHALPILHSLSFAPRDLPKRESLIQDYTLEQQSFVVSHRQRR